MRRDREAGREVMRAKQNYERLFNKQFKYDEARKLI